MELKCKAIITQGRQQYNSKTPTKASTATVNLSQIWAKNEKLRKKSAKADVPFTANQDAQQIQRKQEAGELYVNLDFYYRKGPLPSALQATLLIL